MSRQLASITLISGATGMISIVLAVAVGGAAGIGGYTFVYAEGGSYLTNDATACANCHVMRGHYDAWVKSSHQAVATCNDSHTPHHSLGKLLTKASNGFNHSLAFTTGRFHEPIEITPRNQAIVESACRHCHGDIVQAIDRFPQQEHPLSCIRCHMEVGPHVDENAPEPHCRGNQQ